MDFLEEILSKIARRYALKGCLSGTMKLGQHLDSRQMAALSNYFGLAPLRVNKKEEVRLLFKDLLQDGSESQWLGKFEKTLGYPLQPQSQNISETNREAAGRILAGLMLAYPDLHSFFSFLKEDDSSIRSILKTNSEKSGKAKCFTMAELISFLFHNIKKKPLTLSDLGAQFYQDSKVLRQGELRTLLIRWLRIFTPESASLDEDALLARHHIIHDKLTVNVVLYAPVIYEKNGKTFDWICQLYQQGEPATLSWSNLQNIDKIYFQTQDPSAPDLICSENEAPFTNLIKEKKQKDCCLLFTGGFPSSAVQTLYQLLAPLAATCYHWGDSDPAGLRIAAIMHELHPLQLYRCDLSSLQQNKKNLLSLAQQQKDDILSILMNVPDFPFSDELLFTLDNGWLEQESWR